jgi:hypothetical protein
MYPPLPVLENFSIRGYSLQLTQNLFLSKMNDDYLVHIDPFLGNNLSIQEIKILPTREAEKYAQKLFLPNPQFLCFPIK